APEVLRRPRQGRLGDCWLMAPRLARHETAPERVRALVGAEEDGLVPVHLPGVVGPLLVDRRLPVDEHGRFQYARRDGANPGWAGVLEKAIAGHVAGGYGMLQRGGARFGLELLTGERVRTRLRFPDAAQILAWRAEGRALCASTHPLSPRVCPVGAPLPPNPLVVLRGPDPVAGHVAGGYGILQRGVARFGLELLTGERVRTRLRFPDAAQILAWRAEGRALCASTHPLSPRVGTVAGPLPPNHVFVVVGADAASGHVHLRNPVWPAEVVVLDARSFRRGFLSVDATAPLR